MSFLDGALWHGNISLNGWRPGGAGDAPVMEPATGKELGRTGRASVADVAEASEVAVAAQKNGRRSPTSRAVRCCVERVNCSSITPKNCPTGLSVSPAASAQGRSRDSDGRRGMF